MLKKINLALTIIIIIFVSKLTVAKLTEKNHKDINNAAEVILSGFVDRDELNSKSLKLSELTPHGPFIRKYLAIDFYSKKNITDANSKNVILSVYIDSENTIVVSIRAMVDENVSETIKRYKNNFVVVDIRELKMDSLFNSKLEKIGSSARKKIRKKNINVVEADKAEAKHQKNKNKIVVINGSGLQFLNFYQDEEGYYYNSFQTYALFIENNNKALEYIKIFLTSFAEAVNELDVTPQAKIANCAGASN